MVNVTMRQYNVVNLHGVNTGVAVHRIGLHAFTLINAAIEEDLLTGGSGNQMLASGNFAGGA